MHPSYSQVCCWSDEQSLIVMRAVVEGVMEVVGGDERCGARRTNESEATTELQPSIHLCKHY